MYSVVLMAAMVTTPDVPDGRRHGRGHGCCGQSSCGGGCGTECGGGCGSSCGGCGGSDGCGMTAGCGGCGAMSGCGGCGMMAPMAAPGAPGGGMPAPRPG